MTAIIYYSYTSYFSMCVCVGTLTPHHQDQTCLSFCQLIYSNTYNSHTMANIIDSEELAVSVFLILYWSEYCFNLIESISFEKKKR